MDTDSLWTTYYYPPKIYYPRICVRLAVATWFCEKIRRGFASQRLSLRKEERNLDHDHRIDYPTSHDHKTLMSNRS